MWNKGKTGRENRSDGKGVQSDRERRTGDKGTRERDPRELLDATTSMQYIYPYPQQLSSPASSALVILVHVVLSEIPIPVAIPYIFPPISQRYDLNGGIPVDLLAIVSRARIR